MIYPMWLNILLAVLIALVEYFQQQTTVRFDATVTLIFGAVQVVAGVLMAFQQTVTRQVRKARGLAA